MQLRDLNKLITLLVVNIGAIYLTASGHLDSQAVVAILGASLGYVFGNGHGIMEGKKPI